LLAGDLAIGGVAPQVPAPGPPRLIPATKFRGAVPHMKNTRSGNAQASAVLHRVAHAFLPVFMGAGSPANVDEKH